MELCPQTLDLVDCVVNKTRWRSRLWITPTTVERAVARCTKFIARWSTTTLWLHYFDLFWICCTGCFIRCCATVAKIFTDTSRRAARLRSVAELHVFLAACSEWERICCAVAVTGHPGSTMKCIVCRWEPVVSRPRHPACDSLQAVKRALNSRLRCRRQSTCSRSSLHTRQLHVHVRLISIYNPSSFMYNAQVLPGLPVA